MKKIVPYLLSLIVGSVFGFLIFNNRDIERTVFSEKMNVTGFQVGVFNDLNLAKEFNKKFPSSIIIKNDDIYRVYYAILTNDKTIKKMEEYLDNEKISYYKKDIVINDKGLIKAINNYEKNMLDGGINTFISINKLIMDSYGGKI